MAGDDESVPNRLTRLETLVGQMGKSVTTIIVLLERLVKVEENQSAHDARLDGYSHNLDGIYKRLNSVEKLSTVNNTNMGNWSKLGYIIIGASVSFVFAVVAKLLLD